MKAHRRQELKQNELVQTLKEIRAFLERHGTYVAGGVIVAAVIVTASLWWRSSMVNRQRRQWEDYYALQQSVAEFFAGQTEDVGTQEFDTLIARHKSLAASVEDPLIRLRVLQALADVCWQYVVSLNRTDTPEETARILAESASAYEQITREVPDDYRAVGNAMLGLAAIAEERGELDQAQAHYRKIESDPRYADTLVLVSAKAGLERLDLLREPVVFAPPPPPPKPTSAPVTPTTQPVEFRPSTGVSAPKPPEVTGESSTSESSDRSETPENTGAPTVPATQPAGQPS